MATPRQSVIDEASPGSSSCPIVRHEQTFPELASLGPAVAQGDTVLDEALPLLHLQALRSPQSSVDILPGARKTLAKYPCVVSGFCRGASSGGRTTNAASPTNMTRPKTVPITVTSTIVCMNGSRVAATNSASLGCSARDLSLLTASDDTKPWGREARWCFPSLSTRAPAKFSLVRAHIPHPV